MQSTTAGVSGAVPSYFFLEPDTPAWAAEQAAFVAATEVGKALPVSLAYFAALAPITVHTGAPVSLASVRGQARRARNGFRVSVLAWAC